MLKTLAFFGIFWVSIPSPSFALTAYGFSCDELLGAPLVSDSELKNTLDVIKTFNPDAAQKMKSSVEILLSFRVAIYALPVVREYSDQTTFAQVSDWRNRLQSEKLVVLHQKHLWNVHAFLKALGNQAVEYRGQQGLSFSFETPIFELAKKLENAGIW